ncbi:MAG: peptidase U34 [Chloroflexi bacterium]|nr:peptidase U34 [Chloroflexota bacterium]
MCDTIIATNTATKQGKAIFAKNSDRHPNESQQFLHIPAQKHSDGSTLNCTYITIPQVKETHATLLSQPFWMWGAEMGINEHGLVIGNEAVFSKTPANKTPALLGMDLLRLGLERATDPQQAIKVITQLPEEFGQGGNCKIHGEIYYHNSFIIANHEEAWVLETIDKEWVARQIQESHNISNCLTIQDEWDLSSKKLTRTNFKKNEDLLYTNVGKGLVRQATVNNMLKENAGKITLKSTMKTLRHHRNGESPSNNFTEIDICMHAGFGFIRNDQSTASMVAYLDEKIPIIFGTGTSAPCTSIFKPLWADTPLPQPKLALGPTYTPDSLYWSHERLHRAVLQNYAEGLATYSADRDSLEEKFIKEALALVDAPQKERAKFSAACFQEAALAEEEWLKRVKKVPASKPAGRALNDLAWKNLSKEAKMPSEN